MVKLGVNLDPLEGRFPGSSHRDPGKPEVVSRVELWKASG